MVGGIRKMIRSEKGQILPLVLALLVFGGLIIAPSLGYATTSLKSSRILEEGVNGVYAADAGIENTLWCLENGVSPPEQLPESINQMEVVIQVEDKGTYTLYLGELVVPSEHADYLDVDGEMVWDEEAGAYKYTITVTWQPESGVSVIHLEEVGARLPIGYVYQSGSAAAFIDNLSTEEPEETKDEAGAYLLNWEFGSPKPSISESNPVRTQTFYVTGEGSLEGDYTWVVASREDIGAIGEITGTLYRITATANRLGDGATTARIMAAVMLDETVYILSWRIS